MKIEIWSDFNCPFCYMGENALYQALESLNIIEECEIFHYCYQLDPRAPKQTSLSFKESFMKKYDISEQEALALMESIAQKAQAFGLNYAMDKIIPTQTLDAHRLAKHLSLNHPSIHTQLYKGYFTDGLDLSSHEDLLKISASLGVHRDEILSILNSSQYLSDCLQDQKRAKELNISGVPHILINGRHVLHGAYPKEELEEKLKTFILSDIKRRNHE